MFAALAISRQIEDHTGWSIKKFVTTARRYRTVQIQAGEQTITAADPLPEDLRTALDAIRTEPPGHKSEPTRGPPSPKRMIRTAATRDRRRR